MGDMLPGAEPVIPFSGSAGRQDAGGGNRRWYGKKAAETVKKSLQPFYWLAEIRFPQSSVSIWGILPSYGISTAALQKVFYAPDKDNVDNAYVQVCMTIMGSRETEDREYRPFEKIRDNYPKYLVTRSNLIQRRDGVKHVNIGPFMKDNRLFD